MTVAKSPPGTMGGALANLVNGLSMQIPLSFTSFAQLDASTPQVVANETQTVLPAYHAFYKNSNVPLDERLIPLAVSAATIIALLIARIRSWRKSSNDTTTDANVSAPPQSRLQRLVKRQGSASIFVFNIFRFLACLALTSLSGYQSWRFIKTLVEHGMPLEDALWSCPEFLLTRAYLYSTILAFLIFKADAHINLLIRSNIAVTFSIFAIYIHRDLWPLATFNLELLDKAEGAILWIKVALLAFVAIFVPLFIPTRYVPVDPKDPSPVPHPEQTASIISRYTWTYLDPVVWLGYRVPHLSHTQIPDIADFDKAPYLKQTRFEFLDPLRGKNNKRHLFWGLMIAFRREVFIMFSTVVGQAFVSLISPTCINRILYYLEQRSNPLPPPADQIQVKPWFWICGLFVGTVAFSVLGQTYLYYFTVILVRAESLLTQLAFEHGLRIRLKAETNNDSKDGDQGEGSVAGSQPGSGTSTPKGLESETSSVVLDLGDAHSDAAGPSTTSSAPSVAESENSTAIDSTSRQPSSATTLNAKGKSKASKLTKKEKEEKEKKEKEKKKDAGNLTGKINNLVTTDLNNIGMAGDFVVLLFYIPLQIGLCMIFLYQILGWSAFIGFGVLVATLPLPGYIAKLSQDVSRKKMEMTDARVQVATEIIGVVRMIKLFGWENRMADRLQKKRDDELKWLLKMRIFELANGVVNFCIPLVTMLSTYAFYAAVLKQSLSVSIIFSSMAVFNIIQEQLHRIAWTISTVVQGKVSLDRYNEFLKNTELLDEFVPQTERKTFWVSHDDDAEVTEATTADVEGQEGGDEEDVKEEIGFRKATFSWSAESRDGTLTPRSRSFRLNIKHELLFKEGGINLIIGPTGSGKTSILMALLGEMHFIPTHPDSWFNLPRKGGVAYASQESWVQNQTIRDNILFGAPYDEQRYKKVLKHCALEKDMELFEAGDLTEVGERGLTLSGGQKARVTLARAIYSPAKVVLLDDILAALDVHTAAWIVDKCLRGDLVKGRTILLVTHNVALTAPIADFIVSLRIDGTVKSQGTELKEALTKNSALAAEVKQDQEATEIAQQDMHQHDEATATTGTTADEAQKKKDGKLVVAEEIKEGHVTWRSFKLLLKGLAGEHPILFFGACITFLTLSDWTNVLQTWFLGYWGSQYETHHESEVQISFYLTVFASILLINCLIYSSAYVIFTFGIIRATRSIHLQLMDSVFHSTLRWLDETPVGRIITRFTQDIRSVDGPVSQDLIFVAECAIDTLSRMGVVILFSPIFLAPSFLIAFTGIYIGNMYLQAQLSMKRETSNARAPLLAHFSAAIHGLVSVRAYGAQEMFKNESLTRLTHYTKVARTSWALNRWIAIRVDLLGATFTASLASYLVYFGNVGAANTGLSLNMALSLSMFLLYLVRIWNHFEVEANSLERIQAYLDIDHEPKPTEEGKPPAAWPTSGDLRVEGLSARYSKTSPNVLHNLSFHVKAGERVGIVGRTGSGKSSLTLALLRCILTEGKVYYDGIATDTINLDALRSNITIIPQTPELLSGTLRENLDPFDQHDDAALNDALHAAGLFSLQEEMEEGRITLDTKISGGGTNLSVGQRQILALARAMVRGSKLLILDEATSAIDYKTDSVIQTTLRERLASDVTVITIAHRLQTIMDADKILVLDSGNIVEFDSPKNLLQDPEGRLTALVEGSGDKEALIAMAEGSGPKTAT